MTANRSCIPAAAVGFLCLWAWPAAAEPAPAAPQPPATPPAQQQPAPAAQPAPQPAAPAAPAVDFSKGALFGKVIDLATGKPVAGATVALQDKKGKVLAWTQTDAQGQYAIAADSLEILRLQPSRRRGLLTRIARGIGGVVMMPVKATGVAVKGVTEVVRSVNPVQTAKATAISAATGNPVPAVAQIAGSTLDTASTRAERTARERAARSLLGERLEKPKDKREDLVPGETFIAVSAPSYKEIRGKAGAYWLEPPAVIENRPVGTRAWLESVKLAPTAGDKKSEVENVAVLLAEPRMDPALAPAGGTVALAVKLQTPGNQPLNARVFARENKKRTVVELKGQGNNVYAGELVLDPETPIGNTVVTIVALRAEPVEVKLEEKKADPLLEFARQLDDLDANEKYEFDPRIMASENRLDLTLTVLDPRQGTPATAPLAPTAPPAPAAPEAAPPAPTAPAPTPATPPANPPAPPGK